MSMRNSLLLAMFAGISVAQQPPPQRQPIQPRQQQNSQGEPRALKAYLGMTDEQLDQMHKAGEAAQKYASLRDLLLKGNPDPMAVGKALLEVRAIESRSARFANRRGKARSRPHAGTAHEVQGD